MYKSLHERIDRLLDGSDGLSRQLKVVLGRSENLELRLGDLQLDGDKSRQDVLALHRMARDGFDALHAALSSTLTFQLQR